MTALSILRALLACGAVAAAVVVGCSNKDPETGKPVLTSGGKAGSAGANGGGGNGNGNGNSNGGTGTFVSGPAITSAPPAWVRPTECQGIGNLCPNLAGCETGSTCQLEGNVCIPAIEPGATSLPSKSMERPYCAAYTCMTFDQASCFCTGEAAATEPGCLSPAALAGLCKGEKGNCASMACCDGLSCVNRGGSSACEVPCNAATDCETGCCADAYDTGVKVCAPQKECTDPCKKHGEACGPGDGTRPSTCCRGTCVSSEDPNQAGCRADCAVDADCTETGCCVLFTDSTKGFCAEAVYCSCTPIGSACGSAAPNAPQCCEGSMCARQADQPAMCHQTCTQPSECATNCCRLISSGEYSICAPAGQCL